MNTHFGITNIRNKQETIVAEIDTAKAHYKGKEWRALSNWEKKKFENLVVLSRPNDRVKLYYV